MTEVDISQHKVVVPPIIQHFPSYAPAASDAKRIANQVARAFVRRAKALNMKGKRRDEEALSYFLGAHAAFHPESEYAKALEIAGFLVSARGYSMVEEYAAK